MNGLAIIPLRPFDEGFFAIVDVEDLPLVAGLPWRRLRAGRTYVCAIATVWIKGEGKRSVYMHRLLARAPSTLVVDHINRRPLDCRSANLRLCTPAQNVRNRSLDSRNRSGCAGVSLHRGTAWEVRVAGEYIGRYRDLDQAVAARRVAERDRFGAFAPSVCA